MSDIALLNELLDPFAECLDAEPAQRVIAFDVAPAVQHKVDELAEKANEGMLTEEERSDFEALINAADFIAILKLKAQGRLASNAHP